MQTKRGQQHRAFADGMGCLKQGVLGAIMRDLPLNYCSQPECNSKKAKSQLERQGEQGE